MPHTEQEQRCADAVCRHLANDSNHRWRVQSWLDESCDSGPSPDALLSDGSEQVALEIKQLTDGSPFHEYGVASYSLYKGLHPNQHNQRQLVLYPPLSIRIPLDQKLVKLLRRRIADANREIPVGASRIVKIPRRGTVEFIRPSDRGFIACRHVKREYLQAPSAMVEGIYFLRDTESFDHQFLTDECRTRFQLELVRACAMSRIIGEATIEWSEEWRLERLADVAEGQGGVSVIAFTAGFLESAAIESVNCAISKAKSKFQIGLNYSRIAVALHAKEQQSEVPLSCFESAIAALTATDVHPVDLLYLVCGNQVQVCRSFID